MKIICTKSTLSKGVSIVSKAVPSKTTMTILECILIDASTNIIKFTGNDMELGIETIVDGDIIEKGIVAIEAKLFSEIVRRLPDSEVMIQTDSNYQTTITCEKAKFVINSKSGDEFANLPKIERELSVTISEFTLKDVIRQTIFSIADNDSNKIMMGEQFKVEGNILKVMSLDGHRISYRKIELKEFYEETKVIVPGKTLNEISKILSGEVDKEVKIYFTSNHILFEFENTKVISRLIEGEYFNVEQMISKDYNTSIKVNKKELLSCIDRATLLIKESEKKPIILNILEDMIKIKMNTQIGSMDEDIEIEKNGNDLMIGFNPKFLIDALRVIDEEEVNIYFMNSKAPCFIRDDDESYTYLILPVNFSVIN